MPRSLSSATFVTSAAGPADFPGDGLPEVALAGRSNVGKSTLINALVREDIARTSATPGKTRLVNVYRITPADGSAFDLVDLPGYGFAGGGDKARHEFARLTDSYFASRALGDTRGMAGTRRAGAAKGRLAAVVLAIDARHPGMPADVEAGRWFQSLEVPFLLVATKVDKLAQSARARLKPACELAFGVAPLAVSALAGSGLDELWRRIREWTT
jgi:GTP-binding protein